MEGANHEYLFEKGRHTVSRMLSYTKMEGFQESSQGELEVRLEALKNAWRQMQESEGILAQKNDLLVSLEIERKSVESEVEFFQASTNLRSRIGKLIAAKAGAGDAPPIAVQVNMPFAQHDVKNTWGEFDGSYTKWQGFRDRFVAAVHDNDKIAPAYKFSYLKASLTGRANALGEWQLSDQNYYEAWKRMEEVYNKKYATCRELLRHFFRLPMLEGTPKAAELQRMSNTCHETMRQLAAQGVPTDNWDMIIVQVLHEKLDQETACKWEESRTTELPTAKEFCLFLDKRAEALGSAMDNRRKETIQQVPRMDSSRRGNMVAPSRKQAEVKKRPCHLCRSMEHPLWCCPEFNALSLRARQDFVLEKQLCPNCLKTGHVVRDCYQGPCLKCPNRPSHNSVLCPMKVIGKVEATVLNIQDGRKRKNGPQVDSKKKSD
ncbi:uncharacterized protein LOC129953493 [Eupeodes corollae]|uniref:uncharacterized protein LOC129953462 n=1 Tax=Eupeodes corollae TaxID=290404 RepID=UPI0024904E9C|nr:uncharacterized protein LOC129953462 [Eupeodes corollae]XP_055922711.1 uncharacterized protein LOC129953493 [Eupeodes corollae]